MNYHVTHAKAIDNSRACPAHAGQALLPDVMRRAREPLQVCRRLHAEMVVGG